MLAKHSYNSNDVIDSMDNSTGTHIPLVIKKLSIKNRVEELTYDDRIYVLQILKQHLPIEKIIEHADGCRINLDNLTIDIINKIHHIIMMKLQISNSNKI